MICEGSLVVCNYHFDDQRKRYGYNYPRIGDILTVTKTRRNEENEIVLFFDELKLPCGLYEDCFDEIQDEADGDEILNEVYKLANKL
jgi:hypothetical protein